MLTGASLSSHADLEAKLISNSERFEAASRILNDGSLSLAVRLEQLDPLARAINRYRYVPDPGRTVPMMLGACRSAARVTLQSSGEIGDGLRDALTALAEAHRTDNLFEQLDALRTLVNHLRGLPNRPAAGVKDAVIMLLEDTWRYSFQHYFSIKRGEQVESETDTSIR